MPTNYEKRDNYLPLGVHPLVAAYQHARTIKKRRYYLVLPPRTSPWAASSSEASSTSLAKTTYAPKR